MFNVRQPKFHYAGSFITSGCGLFLCLLTTVPNLVEVHLLLAIFCARSLPSRHASAWWPIRRKQHAATIMSTELTASINLLSCMTCATPGPSLVSQKCRSSFKIGHALHPGWYNEDFACVTSPRWSHFCFRIHVAYTVGCFMFGKVVFYLVGKDEKVHLGNLLK